MIYRELTRAIERLLQYYSIIVITGPRQSGKTTLCKKIFAKYAYFNLEDISMREQIAASPKAFLNQYAPNGIVIDEAQQYPDIFSYIQVVSDEHPDYKFVLTGSNNFSLMQKITQSLAGRAVLFTLLPLSLAELTNRINIDTDTLLFNGGYPAVWGKNIPANDVYRNYYNTYIERDMRQLLNVKDVNKFQIFIRLCAGRIGYEFNASALSCEIGVSVHTINEWTTTLEASYVLFRLPPFYRNTGKRLIKTPKIYFYDTGLVCFLLGIENELQLKTHPLRGVIFENIVVLEFMKNRFNSNKDPNLFFYRDKLQHEIDIIQEFGNQYKAYEIKSAKAFHADFLKNFQYLKSILGDSLVAAQVIYDGDISVHSPENGIVNFRNISFG
ncbi:MAG: ATP-binding protein [Prevotellaceae bacterium]|jgi:predicted AAA+ superfamily ATPase|nr:ATP-binding protein [Prevotellaceae bacterium]